MPQKTHAVAVGLDGPFTQPLYSPLGRGGFSLATEEFARRAFQRPVVDEASPLKPLLDPELKLNTYSMANALKADALLGPTFKRQPDVSAYAKERGHGHSVFNELFASRLGYDLGVPTVPYVFDQKKRWLVSLSPNHHSTTWSSAVCHYNSRFLESTALNPDSAASLAVFLTWIGKGDNKDSNFLVDTHGYFAAIDNEIIDPHGVVEPLNIAVFMTARADDQEAFDHATQVILQRIDNYPAARLKNLALGIVASLGVDDEKFCLSTHSADIINRLDESRKTLPSRLEHFKTKAIRYDC